jgi:hypothetical protein
MPTPVLSLSGKPDITATDVDFPGAFAAADDRPERNRRPRIGGEIHQREFPDGGRLYRQGGERRRRRREPDQSEILEAALLPIQLEIQTPAVGGPTYPSGHGTSGAEVALILGMIVAEKREALYERGWEYGHPPDHQWRGLSLGLRGWAYRGRARGQSEVRKGLGLS